MSAITSRRELRVYGDALKGASLIFQYSLNFPADERFGLTAQIRRSSRSVCANIAEAWRKKRYTAHFVSKLSDVEAEAAETQVWIDIALTCGYLTKEQRSEVDAIYERILGQTINLMKQASKFAPHRPTTPSPHP